MAIVTISRGSASGGYLLAKGISERLRYEIVSREDIVHESSAVVGVSESKLQESLVKPPSFWSRFSHERRRYLAYVQAALCEHAQKDNIVYHGNAGHLLLRGIPHVICIRLIAPITLRAEMLKKREKITLEEAIETIEKMDHDRQLWTRFLYGEDWLNPNLYDLFINLKTMKIESAVELACTAITRKEFEATQESRKAMADLLLASRVRSALASDKDTFSAEVQVRADNGIIYLKGRLRSAAQVEAAIRVAAGVKDVRQVDREQLDAPDFTL